MTDSDSDEEIFTPIKKKATRPPLPSLPVQLTWKGVQIQFPSVVLSQDLKETADAALKQLLERKSSASKLSGDGETSKASSVCGSVKREPVPSTSKAKAVWVDCKICGIPCNSEYSLSRHALVHSEADDEKRKFGPCKCGARFLKKNYFQQHKDKCRVFRSSAPNSTDTDTGTIRIKVESIELQSSGEEAELSRMKTTKTDDSPQKVAHIETEQETEDALEGNDNEEGWNAADEDEGNDQIPVLTSVVSTASEVHKCDRCGSQFTLRIQHMHHKRLCERMSQLRDESGRERKHICPQCPWRFIHRTGLTRHLRFHEGSRPYKCDTCLEGFLRLDYLLNHQRNSNCASKTKSKRKPSTKVQPSTPSETTDEIIACPFCPESFSIKVMDDHLKTHPHPESQAYETTQQQPQPAESQVKCDTCSRTFTGRRYLKQHACRPLNTVQKNTIEKSKKSGRTVCPYCKATFSLYANAARHMRSAHKCTTCGLDFETLEEKVDHMKNCTDKPLSPDFLSRFRCHICQISFSAPGLIRHVDVHEKKNVSESATATVSTSAAQKTHLKCDLCGDIFSDKVELSKHCLSHVLEDEPKTGVTPENQSTQKESHSSDQPAVFACKFRSCTHFFSHDEDLWYHVDKKHKSVGNMCCGQCGQDFETEEMVDEHEIKAHAEPEAIKVPPPPPSAKWSNLPSQTSNSDIAIPSTSQAPKSTSIAKPLPALVPSQTVNKPVAKVTVKTERQDPEPEHDNYDDDFMNHDYDDTPPPPPPESGLLVPKTERTEPTVITRPNPFVVITAECRALADSAWASEFHRIALAPTIPQWEAEIPYLDVYVCRDCYDLPTYENRDLFINHLKEYQHRQDQNQPIPSSSSNMKYTCHLCPPGTKSFADRLVFRNHMRYHRRTGRVKLGATPKPIIIPDSDVYYCTLCDNRQFTDKTLYRNHVKYHRRLKKTKGINRPFSTPVSRLVRSDIPVASEYQCTICEDGRKFYHRVKYINHLKYHERVKRENEKKKMKHAHIRPDIPLQDKYTCAVCNDKEFSNRLSYIMHVKYHEKLQLLGKDGPVGVRINSPVQSDIPIQDTYVCTICDNREFKGSERLPYINHMKYHEKLRKQEGIVRPIAQGPTYKRLDVPVQDVYTCELCDESVDSDEKTFTIRADYLRHLNFHKERQQKTFRSNNNWRKRQPAPDSWQAKIPYSSEYSCETCNGRTFNQRDSYIGHLMYHKILEKKGCNRVILSKDDWIKKREQHRLEIEEKSSYECEICNDGRTFANKQSYISHKLYHERRGINRPLKRKWEKKLEIPDQDEYQCDICGDWKTSKRLSYVLHMAYHDKIKQREGQHRRIRTREECAQLRVRYDVPNQSTYTCNICPDRHFNTKINYIAHMSYHKRRKEMGFHGPLRKRTTMGSEDYSNIPDQDSYTCTKCPEPKEFKNKKAYSQHLYYHVWYERKQKEVGITPGTRRRGPKNNVPIQSVYRCKQCPGIKTFTERTKYIIHLNYHKFKQKSLVATMNSGLLHNPLTATMDSSEGEHFSCALCGEEKIFTCRETYQKHLSEHKSTKKKDFQCSMCERSFTNIWSLKSHAKLHTGEKNFVCGDCGKRFMTNSLLQLHQQKSCKKTPCKYTCYCSDKFHTVESLERHVKRVHETPTTVTKIFRCYVCDDQFIQAFELDEHVKMKHPVDYEEFMRHKAEKDAAIDDEPEPMYPEVVMNCDEDFQEACYSAEQDTSSNIPAYETSSVAQVENESEGATGGWNFIPGLTGDDVADEEDSDEEEQINEDFLLEPEDVEVAVPTIVQSINQYVPSPIYDSNNSSSPNISRRASFEVADDEWTPSSKKVAQEKQRKFKGDGQFKCGYCDKKSHRLAYIKTHFSVHAGLPFKYINLVSGTEETEEYSSQRRKHKSSISTAIVAPQPSASSTAGFRQYHSPVVVTVSPQVKNQSQAPVAAVAGRRYSSNGQTDSNLPKPKVPAPACNCGIDDSLCGYLKRCTGDKCGCYIKYKGCSEECDCKRSCGNPYFRTKVTRPLPDLVQVPNSSTAQQTLGYHVVPTKNQSPFPIQSAINSIIEKAVKDTPTPPSMVTNLTLTPTSSNGYKLSFTAAPVQQVTHPSTPPAPSYQQNEQQTFGNVTCYSNQMPTTYGENHSNSQTFGTSYSENTATHAITGFAVPVNSYALAYATGTTPNAVSLQNSNVASCTPSASPQQTFTSVVSSAATSPPVSSGGLQIYRCFCYQDFNSLSSFLFHQWTHKEEKLFLCPICKRQWTTVDFLIRHAKKAHTDLETINLTPCIACDLLFQDKPDFNRHFYACHSDLMCNICAQPCKSKLELATHRQIHGHCNICGMTFFNQTAMRAHLARDHANVVYRNPDPSTSFSGASQHLTGTVTVGGGNGPEVVTLVDLADDDDILEVRPSSPQFPVIVSVAGTSISNTATQQSLDYYYP